MVSLIGLYFVAFDLGANFASFMLAHVFALWVVSRFLVDHIIGVVNKSCSYKCIPYILWSLVSINNCGFVQLFGGTGSS